MGNVSKLISWKKNCSILIQISLKSVSESNQQLLSYHWQRKWFGAEHTGQYLNHWWLELLTCTCVTRPGWVNSPSLVPHICVGEVNQHWFRNWLVVYPAPSHHLNQCQLIVNWTLRNKLQWNSNQNTKLPIHENAFANVVLEMAVIFYIV